MVTATEKQKCTRCGKTKPLSAYRRQKQRRCGRDTICRACRNAHDREMKAQSFGPLPEPEGSELWLKEVQRRAAVIREENKTKTVRARSGSAHRYGVLAERRYRVSVRDRMCA